MVVNDESEGIWKEAIRGYFKVLDRNCLVDCNELRNLSVLTRIQIDANDTSHLEPVYTATDF